MTVARLTRILFTALAAMALLGSLLWLGGWRGILIGALAALVLSSVGEVLFRRWATAEERRADLEDRVRHPPD